MTTKVELPVEVQNALDWLKEEGFTAAVVGGFCRHIMYGKGTADIDIAVLVDDINDVEKLQDEFGTPAHNRHVLAKAEKSLYEGHTGFVADWREGNINIIAYDKYHYSTINELVQSFDFNFNMWYISADGTLANPNSFVEDKKVVFGNAIGSRPSIARIARFAKEFSDWDWSIADQQLKDEANYS
ncbi:tRNA nucleotidyltransferase [Acinetobacter virus fBenAci002]|uniref:tRNA nucleotidyltransferase n=1 Tax=Acinetobacter virus fBenAci002 TaxID=2781369 RepID=A0A7S6U1G4_9CAUD|nr:tRNA nucleotidyltransferase [Acinetobacter virus fBenAci002]